MRKFILGAAVGFVAGAAWLTDVCLNAADKKQPGTKRMILNAMKRTAFEIVQDGKQLIKETFHG